MQLEAKLRILADAAKYDASCASSGARRERSQGGLGNSRGMGICHSYTPDGRCVSLLKVLLTNYCLFDCAYCVNRVSSETPRARFTVDEVVALTLAFYKRNYIEGLFLSSGVIQSPDYTMEQLVEVSRKLREEENYCGYIHLKMIPGASGELVREAGRYADRLSANIELPVQQDLDRLAPAKTHSSIERTMQEIDDGIADACDRRSRGGRGPVFARAGQSTQMIIGATSSSDAAILAKARRLYDGYRLRRVYYSAFSPIPHADGGLPVERPPLVREHRLYQADWLTRFYGFQADELTTPENPDLPLEHDPKLAWALRYRGFFPIDVNFAPREALLRVPGLGVRSVDRLLRLRRLRRVRLADLAKLRVSVRQAKPFLVCVDWRPGGEIDREGLPRMLTPPARQLDLFAAPALSEI